MLEAAHIEREELRETGAVAECRAERCIALCREKNIDCVLGIGGGCCMDIAKGIHCTFGVKQSRIIWDYVTYQAEPTQEHFAGRLHDSYISIFRVGHERFRADYHNDETTEQAGLSAYIRISPG